MNINKIIGGILILASLYLGYTGVNTVSNSTASVEVLDLNMNFSDKSQKQQGYIYLGLAVVMFAGGVYTLNKK